MFKVINIKTGEVVGIYKTKKTARHFRDRLDNAYGAYVHRIVEAL